MVLTVTLNAAIDKRYVVENYQVGEVNRVKECAFVAGGKGLNVSKTARIAGADVLATGFVGGHAGAYIIEAVEKQDVKTDFIQVKGESRSCINIYDSVNSLITVNPRCVEIECISKIALAISSGHWLTQCNIEYFGNVITSQGIDFRAICFTI